MNKVTKLLKRLTVISFIIVLIAGCSFDDSPSNTEQSSSGSGMKIDKERSEIKIGFSQKIQNAPFYVALVNAAEEYAKEEGFEIIITNAEDDMSKQVNDVNDLIAQGIDLLLLNPQDPEGLIPATKAAADAGIPVVILDSEISTDANYVTKVISNNVENGILVGEWVAKEFGKTEINAAVISGNKGNPGGVDRRQGVIKGITEGQLREQGSSKLNIVSQGWGNWSQEGGLSAMEDIIVAHPDVNLIIAENDSMALGARIAVEQAGKLDQITIVGVDGQKEALELIKEGKYGATGLNNPKLIARTALEVGLNILEKGQEYPKVTYTKPEVITQENVDEFYDPDADF